ncbi:MAG: GAF domain-containing protein [Prevotellaceae bacterium]|jgi:GAF domain-containing protein|nr:GAF domain-containing protein [Prevotellaceae bacterium]
METKNSYYKALCFTLKQIIGDEPDSVAVMAITVAAIMKSFDVLWVGFYRVQGDFLVLGPFQGPLACMRIARGKGVCGAAWDKKECIIVPDVDKFPGHIACNALSQSEIVIPLIRNGEVVAVLDIDSEDLDAFDAVDKEYLTQIVNMQK